MHYALEPIDVLVNHVPLDTERELAFAIGAVDLNDAATIRWLAACASLEAQRLDEIDG